MRRMILAVALLLLGAQRAYADPRDTVGTEAHVTRYGTTHRTLLVSTVDATADIGVTEHLTLLGRVPVASTQLNERCCLVLGNLTMGARWSAQHPRLSWAVAATASLPTAVGPDEGAPITARFAATAELFRGAGRFLPATTTLALLATGRLRVGARGALFGAAGVDTWHHDGVHELVVPLTLGANFAVTRDLDAAMALITLCNPWNEETLLHAVAVSLTHRGPRWIVGVRAELPVDDSLRQLGMFGGGVTVARVF